VGGGGDVLERASADLLLLGVFHALLEVRPPLVHPTRLPHVNVYVYVRQAGEKDKRGCQGSYEWQ
jgi:hypothetical protein